LVCTTIRRTHRFLNCLNDASLSPRRVTPSPHLNYPPPAHLLIPPVTTSFHIPNFLGLPAHPGSRVYFVTAITVPFPFSTLKADATITFPRAPAAFRYSPSSFSIFLYHDRREAESASFLFSVMCMHRSQPHFSPTFHKLPPPLTFGLTFLIVVFSACHTLYRVSPPVNE